MALTGPLSPNGKQALLGLQIWEEEINAKGGLLGRPVKLIYYDDQSQSAPVPGIYTKLLDVDKVDLVLGPYATVPAAAAMPVVMQKNKMMIILFGLGVNSEFKYNKFFAMIPSGPDPKPSFTTGFFEVAAQQNPKPQTVAFIAADQEFSQATPATAPRRTPRRLACARSTIAPIRRPRPTSRRSCARSRRPTPMSSRCARIRSNSVGIVQARSTKSTTSRS